MANLVNLTHTGKLNRKKGTAVRPAGAKLGFHLQPTMYEGAGSTSGGVTTTNVNHHTMSACYHRALNKVFASYMNATDHDGWGVVLSPSADGETVTWGTPVELQVDIHGGTACSYDRKEEKILWVAQSYNLNGRYTASRVVSISGTTPSYGTVVQLGFNEGSTVPSNLGDKGLAYVGDDAGASTGYHVLLKVQYMTDADDRLYAYVGQITAGTTNVTWPASVQIDAHGAIYDPNVCKVADNKVVGAWTDWSTEGWCAVITVNPSGPSISAGTHVKYSDPADSGLGPGSESLCYDTASGKVIFAYWEWNANGGHKLMVRTGTVTGTNIAHGTPTEVIAVASQPHGKVTVCYDENAQRSVLYYKRLQAGAIKLYGRGLSVTGTNVLVEPEELIEAPAAGKSFQKGPNNAFSYACCSTYVSHADVKKTLVIRAGGDSGNNGGLPKATFGHFNKTSLTVDLSQGNSFELDMDTHTGVDGDIATFNITESLGSGKTQMFFLKIISGAPWRNFDWAQMNTVKLNCSYLINGRGTHEVDPVSPATTADLIVGMSVTGTNIPSGTTIASIANSGTFVLSAAPTSETTGFLTCNGPQIIKWPGGTPPNISTTDGQIDVYSFITFDEGTTWYASIEGLNIS